jgi:hypothetical protein
MRLANHRVAEQAPRRPPACLRVRDDADSTARDMRLACVASTRHPGAVGGRSAPPRGHLGTDGPHRTGRLPSCYGSIMRICWRIRNQYLR